ncbi:integrase, catalytic region, zinc finger, CCHC-type containing protein [Tanacetum coccineum]
MGTVRFRNDHFAVITGYGDYVQGNLTICHVYYVEGLGHNLFSVGQFCNGDLEVAFCSNTCYVRNLEGDDLLTGSRDSNLYTISISEMAASSLVCLMSIATLTKSWLWHRRLSHLNFGIINQLTSKDLVDGLPKFKFETYVKSKDLDLWHVITNGDFQPINQNPETKLDEVIPFDKQTDDLKRRLAKNNEAKMVIYNALTRKEYEKFSCVIRQKIFGKLYKSIDSAFGRFNTIITSLKALDEGYSSKNYVRKFLRALHPKWRAKVTTIKESKDLTSLSLD